MGYTVIRYNAKADSIDENRMLVEAVFKDLAAAAPDDLEYLVLELDGGDFVHLVRERDGRSPLVDLSAFKAFADRHADRRSGPVVRSPARIVGNYRMLTQPNRE